jgi:hypothetical protein
MAVTYLYRGEDGHLHFRRRDQPGPKASRGTLTPDQVRALRREYREGRPLVTVNSLADKYKMSAGAMHKIVTGRSYKWVSD